MYVRDLIVLPSQASFRSRIKLHSLLDCFQDTATLAVSSMEGMPGELMSRGYAWVLTRYEIEIMGALPALDEKFQIATFHDPNHGFNTLRVFEVRNAEGVQAVWAKTSWLLLDLASGRPVRVLQHIPELGDRYTAPIDPDFRSASAAADELQFTDVPWKVRFHDLDANMHVNNAVYFEWMFEATPLDLTGYEVRSISASFRSGAHIGDDIRIRVAEVPCEGSSGERSFVYRIEDASGSGRKPMTAFECVWRPCGA